MAVVAETTQPVPATVDTPQPDWNVYQRLAWVAKRVAYIAKDRQMESDYMSYRYVSHDKVVAMLRKPILDAGLMLITDVTDHTMREVEGARGRKAYLTEVKVAFTFINVDNPAESVTYHTVGQGMDMNDKGSGKAVSYAVKYGFLKGFMLETGEDSDKESIDINAEPEETDAPREDAFAANRKAIVNAEIREVMARHELTAEVVREVAGKPGDQMTTQELERLLVKLRARFDKPTDELPSPRNFKDGELPLHVGYQLIQASRTELGEEDEHDWLLFVEQQTGSRDIDTLNQSQIHEFCRILEQHVLAKRTGVMKKGETKNGK